MTDDKTNDAIKRFKSFLKQHPEIIKNVKEKGKSWNEVFDDWVLFGESHEVWETYGVEVEKASKSSSGSLSLNKMLSYIDKIDTKNWQERLENLNGALASIQSLIGQFQPGQKEENPAQPGQPSQPAADERQGGGQTAGRPSFFSPASTPTYRQGPPFFRRD